MNESIFYFFYNLAKNSFIYEIAVFLHNNTYLFLVFIFLVLVFLRRKNIELLAIVSSVSLSWILARTLKHIFILPRPFYDLNIQPVILESGFSFPSEHASVFFALACSSFFINKKFAFLILILAVLMSLSRVILGVHYPIDILVGAIIGSLIGIYLPKIFKKL